MNRFKKIVKGNQIVYANWFLRQLESIWDFIYFKLLPISLWYKVKEWWSIYFVYPIERALFGFDRRISWGYESTLKFYKKLLSDLIKYSHGYPTELSEICPEEWKNHIVSKWASQIPDIENMSFFTSFDKIDNDEIKRQFSDDCYNCWILYLSRVYYYFSEADEETSSHKFDYSTIDKIELFSEKNRKVVEYNGELYYQYAPTELDEKYDKALKEISDNENYRIEQFKLGMNEIAKNIIYMCD